MTTLQRLELTLKNLSHPVTGCCGTSALNVRLDFAPGTGQAARDAAYNYARNTFDWSATAHAAWLTQQRRTQAGDRFDAIDVDGKLFRALAAVLRDEINLIRAALVPPLPARTAAQLRTALANKLAAIDS